MPTTLSDLVPQQCGRSRQEDSYADGTKYLQLLVPRLQAVQAKRYAATDGPMETPGPHFNFVQPHAA
jgi:hypothetical protein